MSAAVSQQRLWALTFLTVLAAYTLFVGLGAGPFEVYDEGLYGMYAQNALHHHSFLHAVDTHGNFPAGATRYSKPPLVLWLVAASFKQLGPSLFALRLPFALASLASTLLLFAWGQRFARGTAGIWLGTLWASCFLVAHGVYHYGRTATIEPVLILFVLLALYAGARASAVHGWRACAWSTLAGLAVALAFMTKQVVCVLALAPLLAVFAWQGLRAPLRDTLARVLPVLLVPSSSAAIWVWLVVRRAGKLALTALWEHGVSERVGGFNGVHHRNYLNRVAEQLDLDAPPLAWELGLVGLVLFVLAQRRAEDDAWGARLVGAYFACAWLAFDVGSKAILPWYVLTLLPGIALGSAYLLQQGAAALLAGPELQVGGPRPLGSHPSPGPLDSIASLTRAAGLLSLVLVFSTGTRGALSALLTTGVCTFVLYYLLSRDFRSQRPARLVLALGALSVLVGVLGRDGYFQREPNPLSTLGSQLAARGAKHVSLDDREKTHTYERTTFLGTLTEVTRAPWSLPKAQAKAFDARVERSVLPRELSARPGILLLRAPGAFAVLGDLTNPPFAARALDKLLAERPLTFEAESFVSERHTSLAQSARASGGAVRKHEPWLLEPTRKFWLARGSTPELPPGSYEARFVIDLACSQQPRKERLGYLRVAPGGAPPVEQPLLCLPARAGKGAKLQGAPTLRFKLTRAARVELGVRYETGSMVFDRVELGRAKSKALTSP